MQTLAGELLDLVTAATVEPQETFDRSLTKKGFGLLPPRSGFKGHWGDDRAI